MDAQAWSNVHIAEPVPLPEYAGGWVVGGDNPHEGLMLMRKQRPAWLVRTVTPWLLPIRWFSGHWVERGLPRAEWIET